MLQPLLMIRCFNKVSSHGYRSYVARCFVFLIELLKSPSTAEEVLNFYIGKSQQQHIFVSA